MASTTINHTQDSSSPAKGGGARVSLACIPCRTQHVRCDAKRPQCSRCCTLGKQCHYTCSRRGGLTHAALAARRNAAATTTRQSSSSSLGSRYSRDSSQPPRPVQRQQRGGPHPLDDGYMSQTDHTSASLGTEDLRFGETSSLIQTQYPSVDRDPFIDLYYKHFHRYHPFVLPQSSLQILSEDTIKQVNIKPLISVMRFVGSLYAYSNQSSQLRERVTIAMEEAKDLQSPFMAQCHLLYSIALYWCGAELHSRDEMDTAIRIALDLAMNRCQFAAENGSGDPILEESWRRTWWQIYIVDANYAAMKRTSTFPTLKVEITTELPCEEHEYASGVIPYPKTLEDFNSREFAPDSYVYSSFAYLIGAIHGVSSAISRVLSDPSCSTSPRALDAVDTMIDGWMLLVPESKAKVFSKSGEIDEHMFHAYMALHASIVGLHRPFSELLLDPMEAISSCSSDTINGWPKSPPGIDNVHTTRCLKSIEAQLRLLALPAQPCCHTPFAVCMLTTGTIPLLSACKFVLVDQRLAVARDQIRMSIGCLKSFAGVWPRAAKNLQEVQTIAREMLGYPALQGKNARVAEESLADGDTQPHTDLTIDPNESTAGHANLCTSLDALQSYWDLSDLQTDFSAWFTTY